MFTKLEVDNFKSLADFSIEMKPMTVIVGNNATGKSSVLQAIDFLCSCVKEDFNIVIERRNWTVENIKSKMASSGSKIHFLSEIQLPDQSGNVRNYRWDMYINAYTGKNQLELYAEEIIDMDRNEKIIDYVVGKRGIAKTENGIFELPTSIRLNSSVMKILGSGAGVSEEIADIKRFLLHSISYEMLSPSEMRLSSRGSANQIGMSGKNLPSFIKNMKERQKIEFMNKVQYILDGRITDVKAQTKGKPGWTQINVHENFENKKLEVTSKELSDGILRVLAFIAISEIEPVDAVILLDEIENGINSDYAERLLNVLGKIYLEKRHQLILTTHSTVFLDYVDKESIVYLYRDGKTGVTVATQLFDNEIMNEKLQYMYPGEILLNMTHQEIMEILLKGEKNGNSSNR